MASNPTAETDQPAATTGDESERSSLRSTLTAEVSAASSKAMMSKVADYRRMSAVLETLATVSSAGVYQKGEVAVSEQPSDEAGAAPPPEQPAKTGGHKLEGRILDGAGPFRRAAYQFVESRFFSTFILVVILLNTVTLILKCFKYISINSGISMVIIENVFLGVYLTEATMKLIAYKHYYFYTFWNCLDFFIIVNNLAEFVLPLLLETGDIGGMGILRLFRIFKAIRALRALRVLRTIRFLSSLNVILTTMFESIQSIGSIVVLMVVVMYMFSVMGKSLFESTDKTRFGSLWKTFLTLFQLLTLDDWFFIYTDNGSDTALFFYLFFYIVVEYFVFLNLFVAVLLDNFQLTLEISTQERKRARHATLTRDMHDSDKEEEAETADGEAQGTLTRKPASAYYHEPRVAERMERYLQLLASLELHLYQYQRQQALINHQVDLCMFEEAQE
ncbi:cation channel sperm-associated protein 1-like [Pollicipes pollicipes]|uniref:cation channel sperm-associated protein 1-like n=1 Tax=Pollicipes pollicipes TaxID=41117 RepID=UPI00188503E4|nr:cation channel sperm-associated protein 1-like [Pollicipes pollicipes]